LRFSAIHRQVGCLKPYLSIYVIMFNIRVYVVMFNLSVYVIMFKLSVYVIMFNLSVNVIMFNLSVYVEPRNTVFWNYIDVEFGTHMLKLMR
jgi:hypothetical protein